MHPSLSVIFFTSATGIGYGLLAVLGVLAGSGLLPAGRPFAIAAFALALGFISAGLISSTLHLGRPERAWRAFSQWRSSWLSREGVAAVVTYVPAGLFALAWLWFATPNALVALLGALSALMAAATVYCTAMIYASLRPIRQWHNPWVVPNYLLLALFTGALWLNAIVRFWQDETFTTAALALAAGLAALVGKLRYWNSIDTGKSASTVASATGLGNLGSVRLFEAPHTEENYLLREMGFVVARRHAAKLRRIALALLFALPLLLTLPTLASAGAAAMLAAVLACLSAGVGVLIERWLFFAEAKHTVTLYYGAEAA
jgi:sulfite dehydrogenase (quinone) subunit SoeC